MDASMAEHEGPSGAEGAPGAEDHLARAVGVAGRRLERAGWLSVVSALLWIPQAAAVAWLLQRLALVDLGGAAAGERPAAAAIAGAGALSWPGVGAAVAAFFALGLIRLLLDAQAQRNAAEGADAAIADLRRRIVRQAALLSPVAAGRPPSAEFAALAADKIALLRPWLMRYHPARLRVAIVPLALIAVAASQSWVVAVLFLIAGPLIPLFMALIGMAAQKASERQMEELASLNALLMERLAALADIRLLDAIGPVSQGFRARAEALRRESMGVLRIAFLSSTVLELFAALGVALVAVYVGFSLLGDFHFGAWGQRLSVGQGVFLLMLAPAFFQPLRDVAAAWHDRAAAAAVARDLAAFEKAAGDRILGQGNDSESTPAAGLPEPPSEPLPGPARIELRGCAVCLPGRGRLGLPDLEVEEGETIAVTGPSGSGKTTLLAAIGGLIRPCAGEIRVAGGTVLDEASADAWRARIVWIGQKPRFLAASLRRNLALGAQEPPAEEEIRAALAAARAEGIVARLPRGLQTRLGESGAGVSGGEARRLLIARAFLSRGDVVLADEPTADLDPDTAAAVAEGLLRLAQGGRTLVVATHDENLAGRLSRRVALDGPGPASAPGAGEARAGPGGAWA